MKFKVFYLVILTITFIRLEASFAQERSKPLPAFSTAQCNCEAVKIATDSLQYSLYEATKAESFVTKLIQLLNKNQLKPFTERIRVLPGSCAGNLVALATICDGARNIEKGRYILYNNKAMTDILDLDIDADQFVLAHEVGHHTHNHLHFTGIGREAKELLKTGIKDKIISDEKLRHIQELEADALAIWFLKLNNPKIADTKIVDMITGICNLIKADEKTSFRTHPSFDIRKRMAEKILKNWETVFKTSQEPQFKTKKFVEEELDSVLIAAHEADITEIEMKLRKQAFHHLKAVNLSDSAKILNHSGDYGRAIELYNEALSELELSGFYTNEEKLNISEQLKACQGKIKITRFFVFYPLVGVNYILPKFSSNNKPIDAAFKHSIIVGFRAGLYNWTRKIWSEVFVNYSKQEFYTLTNKARNSVEYFAFNQLTTGVNLIFSSLANSKPSLNWKTGIIATAAPTYHYFFRNTYSNYITQEYNKAIEIVPSIGFALGLGIEKISRKRKKVLGNFRIIANYNYQNLKFGDMVPVRDEFKGRLNQFSINLSYRQW
ncbi:hypothetical protein [Emticicia sp. TH156]|uniref:hypothetical protein n=1 Tax=Emticicia sp. TH156 TaxID=2067454 RepID=UPI000C76138D|nr:hypothetical protein [Emticicia sp. TH156]PLK42445.1 hypothetical protein C0V77_20740 [Emticicia sp. TH156]